jgi:hypothetical protein
VIDADERREGLRLRASSRTPRNGIRTSENIEIYMLACSRGIAIVESQFNEKLN